MGHTQNIKHFCCQDPEDLVDDELDLAGPGAAIARAYSNAEDEDWLPSNMMALPPANVAARFCSADACSVRKDATRRARRLLLLPAPAPSKTENGQQQQLNDPSTAALGVDGAAHGGGEV